MVRVICEGKTDKEFFKLFLEHLNIECSDNNFEVMGNKSNLLNSEHSKYDTLKKQIEAGKVVKLLFILDADQEFQATEDKIKQLKIDLQVDNISDYIIMCNSTQIGYLESLILETIPTEHKKCIEDFLECSEHEKHDKDIVQHLYKKYYPERGFDFSHQSFEPLKEKLKTLFE